MLDLIFFAENGQRYHVISDDDSGPELGKKSIVISGIDNRLFHGFIHDLTPANGEFLSFSEIKKNLLENYGLVGELDLWKEFMLDPNILEGKIRGLLNLDLTLIPSATVKALEDVVNNPSPKGEGLVKVLID